MRLHRLDLVAFGPFSDRSLDLSGGAPGGLHLVYGRNAAGKSTALRAIGDLLFGIPVKTGDDHVHPYQNLRIRAELSNGSAAPLVVQRLKRAKDALRDAGDAPLDEAVLSRMLGGLDRKTFERVFGLDHERLREAGQALLVGGGDVGESLFDAGAGGHSVRRVLEHLEGEADKLFKPRGKLASINDLLERYKSARRRVREAESLPEAYATQVSELERDKAEREAIRVELARLRDEQRRTLQLQSALKNVSQRAQLLAQIEALGAVPDLPSTFSERRERAERTLTEERAHLASVERELERLRERQRSIQVPEGLLAVGAATMHKLRDDIGRTRKAWEDLPERRANLATRRRDAAQAAAELGFESLEQYLSSAQQQQASEGKVRKVLSALSVTAERRRGAEQRAREAELALDTARRRLAALPAVVDFEPLEAAAAMARASAGVPAALTELRRQRAELAFRLQAELAELAPFVGDGATLAALKVPDGETVSRFARTFEALDQREQRAREAVEGAARRLSEALIELDAEARAGGVPSEAELEQSRLERDRKLELLLAGDELPEGYRAAVSHADLLADRLRREAARVASRARREAERDAALAAREIALAGLSDVEFEREAIGTSWQECWAAAGFLPLPPLEMRSWLERRARACDHLARDVALAERAGELGKTVEALSAALDRALGDGTTLPLEARIARCEQVHVEARRRSEARQALLLQIADCEARAEAAAGELALERQGEQEKLAELARAVRALGLGAELAPEDVESRLQAMGDLSRVRDQILDLERRIGGMERDERAFEEKVRALVAEHAPELAALPADRAAEQLHDRFERARRDREQLEALLPELAEREREQTTHAALAGAAQRDLEALMSAAGARDLGELIGIEGRARRAQELGRDLLVLERTLAEAAGPRGLATLIREAEGADGAELAARLDELERRLPELEDRHSDLTGAVASKELGLRRFDADDAAQAAEEEQALGAALRRDVDRWAQARLAAVLLRREIERYREEHQGPVLRRASELFARLTRAAYRGLRVGREERYIVAVRANDAEVGVEGLNDAARYHLYLALRLASLEGFLQRTEPLPLVLDDVLIDFDEEGSRAALDVLGELSQRVQILLFTHHRHNLELAREAVAGDRLFIHEL
jgi:uncharacterized protein YhaN